MTLNRAQLLQFVIVLVAFVAACGPREDSDDRTAEGADELITDLVPTSHLCNLGYKPLECTNAPPIAFNGGGRFTIDSAFEPAEYLHALELPYADLELHATGKIYVQPIYGGTPPGRGNDAKLVVYFDQIPFATHETNFLTDFTLQVYLDYNRFGGTTFCFDSGDRRIDFNFVTREAHQYAPKGARQSCDVFGAGWRETASAIEFAANCAPDASTSNVVRCSGEARFTVPRDELTKSPDNGVTPLYPGIGFGVISWKGHGASPEFSVANLALLPHHALTDRTALPTLLFGPPFGFPLKIMSWNVRRFGSPGLKGPFDAVSAQTIGEFLADNDVVALQEGWQQLAVELILKAANDKRAQLPNPDGTIGKPPYKLIGPIAFRPIAHQSDTTNRWDGCVLRLGRLSA